MSIYVYITKQCLADAKKPNYVEILERFEKKIESEQNIESLDRFPPPYLKKRFERQYRLVADEHYVGEHTVVRFLRLFTRGGPEYKAFGDSDYQTVPGVDKMSGELSQENLLRYIENRQDPPPPPPPHPSEEESFYLHSALSNSGNIYHESHCCETHLWVDQMLQAPYRDRLNLFVDPILETITSPDTGLSELRCAKDSTFGILFRRIPELNMVILLTPFKGTPPIAMVKEQYGDILELGVPFDKEAALKKAKRAYSHDLILNEDAWFQIQKEKEGSMALSIEEVEVLESVRGIQNNGFPLFINGRAGSGKSTILQYLFSEYLYHYLVSRHDVGQPVIFACNEELLERARESVKSLLLARHRRVNESADDKWLAEPGLDSRFNSSFRNFYSSLLALIPTSEKGRFPISLMVDYGKFKQWWEKRFAKDPHSRSLYDPDISWHVIRTYIKGTSPEGLLYPEDYVEIPSKHKSVTPETYQIVFEKVWSRYLADQDEQGLWDHQDLARFVLEENLIKPEHPVVFCDEAQDFTRIELEVIDRHSLFNSRTLQFHDAPRVPIAFAGDPFQTLNPTGFRWSSTKAFFVDKFIKSFPGQPKKRELNYRELCYNYRSSRNIVCFCNSVQLVRSVVFDLPDISPQIHWHDEQDSPNVVYFEKNNAEVLGILKDQSEIRIIVPCEDGMEAKWVKQNGLEEFVAFDEANVPKNVVSAVRVKGLEFPRVVLFGFGGACPAPLRKAILAGGDTLKGDQAIESQYFLNRLYVAASRPRKRLFIIDKAEDIESFWLPIFEKQDNYTLKSYVTEAWENELGSMISGKTQSWEADKEDPVETGDKLMREGLLRRDRVFLRQAAQSYDTAGKQTLARQCRAEALEIENDFVSAANIWEELGNVERAVMTVWNDGKNGPDHVIAMAGRHPAIKKRLEYSIAEFLKGAPSLDTGVKIIKDLQDEIADTKRAEEILTRDSWSQALLLILDRLLRSKEDAKGLWSVISNRLEDLMNTGMRIPLAIMGRVAFASGQLERAYQHWVGLAPEERASFERDFLRARFVGSTFSEKAEITRNLLKSGGSKSDAEALISAAELVDSAKFTESENEVIARAYLTVSKPIEGLQFALDSLNEGLLTDYLEAVSTSAKDPAPVAAALSGMVAELFFEQRIDALLDLMNTGRISGKPITGLVSWIRKHPHHMNAPLVALVAEEAGLDSAPNSIRVGLTKHLSEVFKRDFAWKKIVHPLIVGQAFEQIGLFKESLPYYEHLKGSTELSDELRLVAKERWIRVKLQQALHERSRNRRKAEEHLSEAKLEFAGLPYESFDDIPEDLLDPLPPVDKAAKHTVHREPILEPQPPVDTEGERTFSLEESVGPLRIRINPQGNRINIEHQELYQQLSVKLDSKAVMLEGEPLQARSSGIFGIPDWELTIDLNGVNNGEVLLIRSNGMKTSLPVDSVK